MSSWTDHVRDFAKRNNVSYACALSDPKCKMEYGAGKTKPAKAMKPAKAPPKEPKPPRNPLRGQATRKKYVAGETARDALANFKLFKEQSRSGMPAMIGMSPTQFQFGVGASQTVPF